MILNAKKVFCSGVLILLVLSFASSCSRQHIAPQADLQLRSPQLRLIPARVGYSFKLQREGEKSAFIVLTGKVRFTLGEKRLHIVHAKLKEARADKLLYQLELSESGLEALATLTLVAPGTVQVSYRAINFTPTSISEEFADGGEHYYGVWEASENERLDNRGVRKPFLGGLMNDRGANARAPYYFTSKNYGVYVDNSSKGSFTFAIGGKTGFRFETPTLEYYIFSAPSYREIFRRYLDFGGASRMPPLWALGSMWWRNDAHVGTTGHQNSQELIISDAIRLAQHHIPASAMWIDRPYGTGENGWGNMDFDHSFPDPKGLVQDLDVMGFKVMLWIANRCAGLLWSEGSAKNFFFPGYKEKDWPAIDLSKKDASRWFQEKLSTFARLGFKGFKIDRGEEGELPDSAMNLNAVQFPKVAAQTLREHFDEDYFIFSRNLNDRGRMYSALWNGDPKATFKGFRSSVLQVQRAALLNFPMWGSDTGGYSGKTNKELLARWAGFSAFTPFMEFLIDQTDKTIWELSDNELIEIIRAHAETHHLLIPYVRSYLKLAELNGYPLVRPLFLEFPEAEELREINDQYMYGHELLVAPVMKDAARSRKVSLPQGKWLDFETRSTIYNGARAIRVSAALGKIPVFIREGALLVRGDILKGNNSWTREWKPSLSIEWYPSQSHESSFEYFDGKRLHRLVGMTKDNKWRLTFDNLRAPGVITIFCKGVPQLTKNGESQVEGKDFWFDSQKMQLHIPFNGSTTLEIGGTQSIF